MSELQAIPDWQQQSAARTPSVTRAFALDFDVKRSRRIIEGRAVPYGVPERVADLVDGRWTPPYLEEWVLGVFREACTAAANMGRVAFQWTHDEFEHRLNRIGKTLHLDEQSDGLYGQWRVHEGDGGDYMLEQVAEGKLRGLSVSARPRETRTVDGVRQRTRAILDHVALVEHAAFAGAGVVAMREQTRAAKWSATVEDLRARRDQMQA